jgi:hypothetical protein
MSTFNEDQHTFLRLQNLLRNSTYCDVTFTKVDGTNRNMICTLNESLIPEEHLQFKGKGVSVQVESVVPDTHLRVFDLENNGWRTIILDKIITFNPMI